MIEKIINEISTKKEVVILGFGREGKSTYNLIRKFLPEKKLTILDGNLKLLEINNFLKEDKNLNIILGEKYLDNLDYYDMIIKAPGVNFKNVNYESFESKITSQIDLFFKYSNITTIGITGTKGKSTTSSLIYHVLKGLNKDVFLAGNIGIPVFDILNKLSEKSIAVIELSCHQLKFCKHSPNIGALLNLYEEHLDLYRSKEDYMTAKLNIFNYQKKGDYKIWGLNSLDTYKYFKDNYNTYTFSNNIKDVKKGILISDEGLYYIDDDKKLVYDKKRKRNLIGNHNLNNIACTLLVCDILNIDLNKVCDLIDNFNPLEHRMEKVGTYKGITFYNDSIATIPSATINCIKSIDNIKTVIIGGMNRNIDLSSLVEYLLSDNKIITLIFLKDTGYMMYDELLKRGYTKKMYKAKDIDDAVKLSYLHTKEGYSCALSPAAASYNTYKNFEERGKDFKDCIIKYSK